VTALDYRGFLELKAQLANDAGFDPVSLPAGMGVATGLRCDPVQEVGPAGRVGQVVGTQEPLQIDPPPGGLLKNVAALVHTPAITRRKITSQGAQRVLSASSCPACTGSSDCDRSVSLMAIRARVRPARDTLSPHHR